MIRNAILALLIMPWLAMPAQAHRVHEAISEVRYNARTAEVEIVHRVFGHDLEFALVEAGLDEEAAAGSPEWTAFADAFLGRDFGIAINGIDVSPEFVGLEFEGRFVWAYYVVPMAEPYREVAVNNRILAQSYEDQANLTNVFFGSTIRSAAQSAGNFDWDVLTP